MNQYAKKARKWMSPMEIKSIVGEMNQKLIDFNINTVYDINQRLYVIKLSKTDHKEFIVIESGVRVHLTEYHREKSDVPNNFTSRLRKYLNKKRLLKVNQIGNDRVIEIQFGNVTERYSLIVDLYSNGNICIVDQNYKILMTLRSFTFEKTGDKVSVGEQYPLHLLNESTGCDEMIGFIRPEDGNDAFETIFKSESTKKMTLKQFINATSEFGPQLNEHCCVQFGKEKARTMKLETFSDEEKQLMKKILSEALEMYEKLCRGECTGYIFYHNNTPKVEKKKKNEKSETSEQLEENKEMKEKKEEEKKIYEEVTCVLLEQDKKRKYLTFESYQQAMDEFHSHIEKQEYEQEIEKKEMIKRKKVQAVIEGHQKRYQGLLDKAVELRQKAELIQQNVTIVDQLIDEINVFINEKMKWEQIESIIEQLKESDEESIAHYIVRFDFKNDLMILMLRGYEQAETDEENETNELNESNEMKEIEMEVEVMFSKKAHENVRNLYELRKVTLQKAQKTLESKDLAIRQAEDKQERVAKGKKINFVDVKKMRKRFWFEKFHWFISSENFIIISGKDALQNDIMYRRYMKNTDIYVHADIHGAASCLIKGIPGRVIGASTLEQAGKIAVCRSSAWTSKIVTSAWWVYSDQVSKTAPSGEYLTTGSFMIRGKKNYLPPVQLVFGIGIMFAIEKDEDETETEQPKEMKEIKENKEEKEEMKQSNESQRIHVSIDNSEIEELIENETMNNTHIVGSTIPMKKEQHVVVEEVKVKQLEEQQKDEHKVTINEISIKEKQFQSKKDEEKARINQKQQKKKQNERRKEIEEKKKKEEEMKKAQQQKNVRGKSGKNKKLKGKYAEQDDEDRERMEKRIGHSFATKKELMEKEKKEAEEKQKKDVTLQCYVCGSTEHIARDCPVRKEQMMKKQDDKLKEKLNDYLENEEDEDEELKVDDTIFVGELKEGMILKYAVPVCGPYECISKYKYHLKLTPGNMKAGKAIKSISNYWPTWKDMTEIEKMLINNITVDEYTGVMMSDVLVHPPQGKLKQQKWKGGSGKVKKSKGKK